MALAGADMLIYTTAIGWDIRDTQEEQQRQLEAWITAQRGHAVANGLPVFVPNRVGQEPDPSKQTPGTLFWGNIFIACPQVEFLARASDNNEELLIVDLDLKRSEDVRRIWPFLRARRVDAYGQITKRFID